MFTHLNSNIAKFVLVALAYFITAKLGSMVPYKESIVTLIWLHTGIAVGAILRFGNRSLPAIFIAATLLELSVGLPFKTSTAIGISNTLAPLAAAYFLEKLQFNHALVKQRDIGLMIGIALFSMLISATGGTLAVYLSGLIQQSDCIKTWFVWWVGDSVGVMLALPLVLNLTKEHLKINGDRCYQLSAWLVMFALCELLITVLVPSLDKQFMLSIFLILPVLIWASMHFGIVGGSLVVISLSSIAVW